MWVWTRVPSLNHPLFHGSGTGFLVVFCIVSGFLYGDFNLSLIVRRNVVSGLKGSWLMCLHLMFLLFLVCPPVHPLLYVIAFGAFLSK